MPFVSEIDNRTMSVKDTYSQSGDNPWSSAAEATINLSTSGDTVNFTITMATSVDGVNSTEKKSKPYVHLYLNIDDQEIINNYYSASNKFPTLHGSTYSSSITTKNKNDEEIPVVLKVCVSQPANLKPERFKTVTTTLTRTYYTVGGKPTVTISDPGDNTYSIIMTPGDPGDANTRTSSYLYYTTDGREPSKQVYTGMTPLAGTTETYVKNITVKEDHTVKAIAYSSFTYGSETSSEVKSEDILFYADPIITTPPYISHTKNRFTLKEPWKIIFNAEAGNSNAPIASYIVSVFVNDMSKLSISKAESTSINIDGISWETGTQTLTIDPIAKEFKVGDKVKIYLEVRAKTGANNTVTSAKAESIEYVVQNAGIVRVKVNNEWKEGQVYVKAGNTWHEAETVYVKASSGGASGWKESQ